MAEELVDITVLCRRAPPDLSGGWNSDEWTSRKTDAGVSFRETPVEQVLRDLREQLEEDEPDNQELAALVEETFAACISLNCRAAASEHAIAYADVIARSSAGVVIEEGDIVVDHRDVRESRSGAEIEARWKEFDVASSVHEEQAKQARRRSGTTPATPIRNAADEDDWSDV
jgi:hypothetical protein